MLPVAKKAGIRHPPLGGESSQETNVTATWSQRHITEFPPEVLSHIFTCLGCDDIAQVHDTCRLFRKVVLMEHAQAIFYRELPQRFREQFQQSRLWQEQTILNGQHPFTTTAARGNKNRFFDTGQHAALMCFRTLGNMLSTSVYRPVKVFTSPHRPCAWSVDFSLNSANLLVYSLPGRWATVLGPDEAGSWSEQTVDLGEFGVSLLDVYCGNRNGRMPPVFGSHNTIKYLRRDDHGRWQLVSPQWFKASDEHEISPSGKYLAIFTHIGGLKDIRCLDDQGQWILMSIKKSARIQSRIRVLQFSPSGECLAIRYEKVLALMSPDSQGCWNLTWTVFSQKPIAYMEFCPSERWLLVVCYWYNYNPRFSCSADIIRLDPAGKYLSQQEIDCENCPLNFSPAGNYLLSQKFFDKDNRLLWQLLKSGQWVFYGDLVNPETSPLAIEETELMIDIIKISPCDNYLLISSIDGAVVIWGQDAQGRWQVRGREQHDSAPVSVEFSQSGFHVLTVDRSSIRIWGRDKGGSWFVKGVVRVSDVWNAHFHAVAEHLIVFRNLEGVQVWEVRKDD